RQEKTGTTRPHGGLGLGLAIVRHLAELHGGTVVAESAGEGRGATLVVTLPVSTRRQVAPETTLETDTDMPPLDGVQVLVVDDDPSATEMVTVALEHCGAQVT